MVVLDTDLLTLIQRREGEPYERLRLRLQVALPAHDVRITIISFEEQMRGWLAYVGRSATPEKQVGAYRRLHELLIFYCVRQILDFDEHASLQYQQLRKQRIRVGTMDLKIAAIALTQDAILLSRNLRDFEKVPGLRVEDWTLPPVS